MLGSGIPGNGVFFSVLYIGIYGYDIVPTASFLYGLFYDTYLMMA